MNECDQKKSKHNIATVGSWPFEIEDDRNWKIGRKHDQKEVK